MTPEIKKALDLALEALEENHHLIEEHERPEYLAHYDRVISAVSKARSASVQKGAIGAEYQKSPWDEKSISMPPPEAPVATNCRHCGGPDNVLCAGQCKAAAPDLQAELDATNRQVEILSDALAESRRQRQWVGLTDDEFEDIELGCRSTSSGKIMAMQKVEAKLKEKNNG